MKIFISLFILLSLSGIYAQGNDSTSRNKQFIYVIRLIPKYQDEKNWDDNAKKTMLVHFKNLQDLLKEGKLLLAGRTDVELPITFGICVFNAKSLEEATEIGNNDPAVKAGMMTVEVFPFNVALMKK